MEHPAIDVLRQLIDELSPEAWDSLSENLQRKIINLTAEVK